MPIFGYRSHQQVTVLKLAFRGSGGTPPERAENGQPAGYRIRFADGFEGDAFDHETALQLLSPRSTEMADGKRRKGHLPKTQGGSKPIRS
jgi:hypothetical protein